MEDEELVAKERMMKYGIEWRVVNKVNSHKSLALGTISREIYEKLKMY